jgi:uncharacterized protein (TIGR04255 family)
MAKELKNKPLVEAILEVRWKLQRGALGALIDPHYKLLLGRAFDRMRGDYPEHEELPSASLPDELVGHVVQHRFRAAANSWPLVQMGPGIFTVNSTADYKWEDFRPRVLSAIKQLYEAHPKVGDLEITNLVLRYIDAVDYDYTGDSVLEFLQDKLKLRMSLPDSLFQDTYVQPKPIDFTWQGSFLCVNPKGRVTIRFATGQKTGTPVVIWETTVESAGDDLPKMPDSFEGWIDAAHTITDGWFFKMIEGELERRFSGE